MEAQLIVYIVIGIFQVASIIVGGFLVVYRFGRSTKATDYAIAQMSSSITEIKSEVAAMRALMTEVALQNQRLDNQGQQIAMLQRTVEDIRRGEGFILPLAHPAKSLGG